MSREKKDDDAIGRQGQGHRAYRLWEEVWILL